MSVSSDNTLYIQIFERFTYSMLQYNNHMLPVATYTVHCTVVSYVVAECQLGHRLATFVHPALGSFPWMALLVFESIHMQDHHHALGCVQ